MSAYSTLILAESSLVSYWQLNETSGTTAVDSQDSNNGTITSADVTLNESGNGTIGPSIYFNFGTGNPISIPDASNLNSITNLTLELWMNLQFISTFQQVITKIGGGPSYSGWGFQLSSTGLLNFNCGGGSFSSGVTLTLSTWYHVVGTIDSSGNIKIYINGSLVNSQSGYTADLTSTGVDLVMGAYAGGGQYQGNLMHVAVYNTILSGSDILSHYDTGIGSGGGAIADPYYIPSATVIGF
jgi:hypothetical protein